MTKFKTRSFNFFLNLIEKKYWKFVSWFWFFFVYKWTTSFSFDLDLQCSLCESKKDDQSSVMIVLCHTLFSSLHQKYSLFCFVWEEFLFLFVFYCIVLCVCACAFICAVNSQSVLVFIHFEFICHAIYVQFCFLTIKQQQQSKRREELSEYLNWNANHHCV